MRRQLRVRGALQQNAQRQRTLGDKAGIDLRQLAETSHQQPCTHEQDDCQRGFGYDEPVAKATAAAIAATTAGAHVLQKIVAG